MTTAQAPSSRTSRGLALSILLLLLSTSSPLFAQFGASLQGTVEDQTGAVIPNATVTLTQTGNQQQRVQTTSAEGFYRFSELPPGSYSVVVAAANFKSSNSNNVDIAAETPRSLDINLTPGDASETVTVNADDTSALQTADATISGTVDNNTMQRIPTAGRDPYELLRTTPGITGDGARSGNGQGVFLPNGSGPGQSNSGIFQSENQVQISADGQRTADNNFLIDGVSVNSLGYGGAAVVTPNLESFSQITVISTSFDAEDGRNTGAQIKTVTKSGTNQFHGSGIFLYDQPGLNAYNRYGGPLGQSPIRVGNQARTYAGSLGGPIIKDKLFFFLSYEGFTQLNETFPSNFIETPQFRAFIAADRPNSIASAIVGAPGGVPRVAKVLPATCSTPVNLGTPCQVLPGGIDLGSPIGTTGTYVPGGQAQSGGGLDGVPDVEYAQLIQPNRSRGNQYNARGDWTVTPNDRLAGSFYLTKLDNQNVSGATESRPNGDLPFKPLNQAYTAIYIHTFSPSLLNELRGNFTRFAENGVKDGGTLVNWGVPYINVQNMNFDSVNDLNWGVSQSETAPAIFAENTYEIRDTATKTWGSHTIRSGFEYRIEQDNSDLAGASRPVYAFQGLWNFANDAPIYEGITANPNNGGPALTQRYFRDHYWGLFVQHDWKVSPNLTLNMGIRWEYFEPLYNQGFRINYPILGPPGQELTAAILTPHNHLWNSQYKNFSPKVGFAYTPPNMNGKLVVRGGFAMAYNRLPVALYSNAAEDGPDYLNYGLCCATAPGGVGTSGVQYGLGSSQSPFSYAPNPFLAVGTNAAGLPANGAGIEVYGGVPANTQTPYSYLYSFEVQRELPMQWVLTAGYQGSLGRHYARLVNQNFIYNNSVGGVNNPFSSGAYFAQTDSVQSYNGLNLHANKRLQYGVTFDALYTYSKSLDQVSNGDSANSNANQTDPAHNNTEYGPSDYDVRHRVVISGLWDLPKAHSDNVLVKAIANGWQANGLYTWHTGFPFTPVTYQLHGIPTLATAETIGPVRPLAYYGGLQTGCSNGLFIKGIAPGNDVSAPGVTPVVSKYFNITPPVSGAGTPPGIGRNSFRGPCYTDLDMSFAKQQDFQAAGHNIQLRFQANFFNILNQETLTPFTNGNGNAAALIESTTFGQAQSANAGRVVEFLVRLQF
jgi:hypothetical protein